MQRWARLSWKWKGSEGILEDAQTRQFWSSRGRQVYAKLRIILWPTLPCLHSPGSFQGTLNSRKTSWMMQRHPTARDTFTKWLDGKASKAPHGSPDGAESLASHGACSNVESLCQMLLVEKLTWPCLKMASELETPLSCTCSSGRPSKFGASSCRTRSSWPWARHWWRVLSLTRHWAVHYSRSAQLVIFGKRIHWVWGYPMLRTHLLRLLRKRFWFWWPPELGWQSLQHQKEYAAGNAERHL